MTAELTEVTWLEARGDYTLHELVALSGLPREVIDELVACGALPSTIDNGPAEPAEALAFRFAAESIVLARAACRLRQHFELETAGLAVAVSLLRRVRALEARLARSGMAG